MRTRLDYATLLDIVELAYGAAEDPQLWEPVLTSIREAVGANAGCVVSHDLVVSGSAIVQSGLDPESLVLYNEHYHKVDAWATSPAARRMRVSQVTTGEMLIPDQSFRRTEFYAFVRPFGISRLMQTTLRVSDLGSVECLSLYRCPSDAPFGTREVQFMEALTPHLQRSLRLHSVFRRSAADRNAALDSLDAISQPVVFVNEDGRVIHANRAAEAIFARRDGLHLDRGLLETGSVTLTSSLRQLCADCSNTTRREGLKAGGALLVPRASGSNLQILVSPVKRHQAFGFTHDLVTAVVLISDPDHKARPDRALLQVYYGLTSAEADVAAQLAAGDSLDEISAARRYTKQTAQWYAKLILTKTGCRSRAALVRQLSVTLSSVVRNPSTS